MAIAARVLQIVGLGELPSWLLAVVLFTVGVASGAAAHIVVEAPLLRAIRSRVFLRMSARA